MRTKYFFVLIVTLFLFAGCGNTANNGSETFGEKIANEIEEAENSDGGAYLGSWTRTAVYLNGALEKTATAKLTFNPDGTYNSLGSCATSGTYEAVDEGTITMVMTRSNCPGNIPLPLTVTYTYKIEENEDGLEQMTTFTGPQMETYIR